jgi:hypothetical protein
MFTAPPFLAIKGAVATLLRLCSATPETQTRVQTALALQVRERKLSRIAFRCMHAAARLNIVATGRFSVADLRSVQAGRGLRTLGVARALLAADAPVRFVSCLFKRLSLSASWLCFPHTTTACLFAGRLCAAHGRVGRGSTFSACGSAAAVSHLRSRRLSLVQAQRRHFTRYEFLGIVGLQVCF